MNIPAYMLHSEEPDDTPVKDAKQSSAPVTASTSATPRSALEDTASATEAPHESMLAAANAAAAGEPEPNNEVQPPAAASSEPKAASNLQRDPSLQGIGGYTIDDDGFDDEDEPGDEYPQVHRTISKEAALPPPDPEDSVDLTPMKSSSPSRVSFGEPGSSIKPGAVAPGLLVDLLGEIDVGET